MYILNGALITFILSTMCIETVSINCYQCQSNIHSGCFSYNLDTKYLSSCPTRTKTSPVFCRSISQVQYFTPTPEAIIIRECAYQYLEPLTCMLSKFSDLHYSKVCECDVDGCNSSHKVLSSFPIILLLLILLIQLF